MLPSPFAADDGSVPPAVAAVLTDSAAGRSGARELVRVLAGHRLLVPLLEVDAEQLESDDADPCAGQDRAVAAVSLRTGDGVVGLAFTGMAPLTRWDPLARPMPVEAVRVAAAVLAEGGLALLLDPGQETCCRIEGLALQRLAAGGQWPDAWEDPTVRDAVIAELAPVLANGELAVRLTAPEQDLADALDTGPDLVVEVRFPIGTAVDAVRTRAAVVADRLGRSSALRAVFDGVLAVRVAEPSAA